MNTVIDTRNKLLITLTVMIFGLSYGLSAPVIALKLTTEGFSELYVGINAAMHAIGVTLFAVMHTQHLTLSVRASLSGNKP